MDSTKSRLIRPFFGSILLAAMLALNGCGIFNQNIRLAVEPQQYQAFFIALSEKEVTPIQQVLKRDQIVADFWFEIHDPEIGTMGDEFEGVPHKGRPTEVALAPDAGFKDLKAVPEDIEWKNFIQGKALQEGTIFLVKASDGKVYKVKIKAFSVDKIKLTYKALSGAA